jgi:hypothetical protein
VCREEEEEHNPFVVYLAGNRSSQLSTNKTANELNGIELN